MIVENHWKTHFGMEVDLLKAPHVFQDIVSLGASCSSSLERKLSPWKAVPISRPADPDEELVDG